MDPHLPFLKAIAANPADDLPRLVYADFLEENGQPEWAAFIRLHIHSASVSHGEPDYDELKGHLATTSARHLNGWRDHLFALVKPALPFLNYRWARDPVPTMEARHGDERIATLDITRWRRGFPEVVELSEHLLRNGAELFERWPVIGLRPTPGYTFEGFDQLPHLRRLRRLDATVRRLPDWREARADRWLRFRVFSGLRHLSFRGSLSLNDAWLVVRQPSIDG